MLGSAYVSSSSAGPSLVFIIASPTAEKQYFEPTMARCYLLMVLVLFVVSPLLVEAAIREWMFGHPVIDRTKLCNTTACFIYRVQTNSRIAVPFSLPPVPSGIGSTTWEITAAGLFPNGGNFPPTAPGSTQYWFTIRNDGGTTPGSTLILSTQGVTTNPMQFVQHTCADSSWTGEDLVATSSTTLQRLDFPISAANSFASDTFFWVEFNAASQVDFWGVSIASGVWPRCKLLNDLSGGSTGWGDCFGTAGAWEIPIVIWARPKNFNPSTMTTTTYNMVPPSIPYSTAVLPSLNIQYGGVWYFTQVLFNRADIADASNFVLTGFGVVLSGNPTSKPTPVTFRLFQSSSPTAFSSTATPIAEPLATMIFTSWPTGIPAPGGGVGDTLYKFVDITQQINLHTPDLNINANGVSALWVGMQFKTSGTFSFPIAVSTGGTGRSFILQTDCDRVDFAIEPVDARSLLGQTAYMSPQTFNCWMEAYLNVDSVMSTTRAATTSSTSFITSSTTSSLTSTSSSSTSSSSTSGSSFQASTSLLSTSSTSTSSSSLSTALSIGATVLTNAQTTTTTSTTTTTTTTTTGTQTGTLTTGGATPSTTGGGSIGGVTTDSRPPGAIPYGLSIAYATAVNVASGNTVSVPIYISPPQPSMNSVLGFGIVISHSNAADIVGGQFALGIFADSPNGPDGNLKSQVTFSEFLYGSPLDVNLPDAVAHEHLLQTPLQNIASGKWWIAFSTNQAVSICGERNSAGLFAAASPSIPGAGDVLGPATPSWNLSMYALVLSTPISSTPQNSPNQTTPSATNSSKKFPIFALILIVVLLIVVIVAIILVIACVVCKKGSDGDRASQYIMELSNEPSITPMPRGSTSGNLPHDHPLRWRLLNDQ